MDQSATTTQRHPRQDTLQSDPQTDTLRVLGLTQKGRLVRFLAGTPQTLETLGMISGLQSPDTALVGMDFRPQNGILYALGNGGGVYTIKPKKAQATFVNALTIPLMGSFFSVDFSPPANLARIISDAGQNLAHDVNVPTTGTVAQSMLSYSATGTPVALGVTGAAYTNNDLDATTGTVLYDIDPTRGQVVVQAPSGAGLLTVVGQLGIQVDPQTPVGFDIYSRLNASGVAVQNRAYASLVVNGVSGFYRINLTTGQVTFLGAFPARIIDIAIPLGQ